MDPLQLVFICICKDLLIYLWITQDEALGFTKLFGFYISHLFSQKQRSFTASHQSSII